MKIFILITCFIIIAILLISYYKIKNWKPEPQCHCCGGITEKEWICDRCGEFYCDNCSAPFTIHTQIDYPCCEYCYNVYYD